jgi:hypothetical protein
MSKLSAESYLEQRDRALALAVNLSSWIDGRPSALAHKQVDALRAQFDIEERDDDGGSPSEDEVPPADS